MASAGGDEATVAVPTEDAVQALVNHFVSDLLPSRPSASEPSDDHQLLIAKQMHVVVLLYNYYHRKQFPDLEFLGFEALCKVAVISKPSLLSYLKFMRGYGEEPRDLNKQLSITERMISNSCNICKILDATNDLPTMESWPISQITVFLVDATRKKCLLEFCSIANGVWSFVEKNLNTLCDDLVCRSQMKNHMSDKKRAVDGSLLNRSSEVEDALNHLALSIVEEKTGIKKSNLSVLEHHMAYSLSQEKTTARLYIMMYTEAVNTELVNEELAEVPMRDLLISLRGPLFKKGTFCEVTPVVNYCYLFPYVNILSDWLSREASCDESSVSVSMTDKPLLRAKTEDILINEELMVDAAGQNEGAGRTLIKELTMAVSNKKADSSFQDHQEQLAHNVEEFTVGNSSRLGGENNETDMTSHHIPQSGSKNKFTFENHDSFQPVTAPEKNYLLQASLQICQKKLAELCQQQRLLEEEVAIYEMKMHTIINDKIPNIGIGDMGWSCTSRRTHLFPPGLPGGEDALESNVEFIIEACGHLCSRQTGAGGAVCSELGQPKLIKRRKLSEAVLSLQSHCEKLDDICSENCWILPKYSVLPSFADGSYQASITLQGMDFEFTDSGDLKGSPREARESAAFHMLSRLRSIAGQV